MVAKPALRWMPDSTIFSTVVPANAGTHTPRLLNLGGESRYRSPTTKACGYGSRLALRLAGTTVSGPELLAQDAFLEAVTGIEQHPHRDRLVGQHLDAADIAHVVMVGGGRNRALFTLEHLDDNESGVREQGAAPAARAEGADRGQCQKRGVDRQDPSPGRVTGSGLAG